MQKEYLNDKEAAEYMGFSVHALRKWRKEKIGPPFVKSDTGFIRYSKKSIDNYMDGMESNNNGKS